MKPIEDKDSQSLSDESLLSNSIETNELYAFIKIPFTIKSMFSSLFSLLKNPASFIKKWFFNFTFIISIAVWSLVAKTMFLKIVFGVIIFINYLIVMEVIPIQFTYDEKKDSKLKPLWTFFISLYPTWEIYNPLHNNIIEHHEKKDEDEKNEENTNNENNNDVHDDEKNEGENNNTFINQNMNEMNGNEIQEENQIRSELHKRFVEENDDDVEFNDVDHSTSDDDE